MTNPVAPPAAPTVPVYPALGSPSFNQEAYAYGSAMPGVSATLGAIGEAAHTNAVSAQESAAAALQAKDQAVDATDVALAASNFKGAWSALTGQLLRPASVLHNGQYWMLLQDLADVTAFEPGIDTARWAPLIDLKDGVIAATGGVMDCAKGDYFTITVAGSVSLSFVNTPSRAYSCVLEILHNSGVITVPANCVWANGKVPEFVTGKRHLLYFQRAYTGSGGWIMSALEGSAQ